MEEGAGVEINVILDPKQSEVGTTGLGKLAVVINARSIQLFAPTNGYFPDGAVRHEVLHVRRFHVDGVPKLALADNEEWDKGFSDALGALDNAIEHVVTVPEELQFHSDRRKHWETVMQGVCLALPDVPEGERRLAVCLHWTFLRHVLPNSPAVEIARGFCEKVCIVRICRPLCRSVQCCSGPSKEELVRLLFHTFPEIPKHRTALEYINSMTGTCQKPIHRSITARKSFPEAMTNDNKPSHEWVPR